MTSHTSLAIGAATSAAWATFPFSSILEGVARPAEKVHRRQPTADMDVLAGSSGDSGSPLRKAITTTRSPRRESRTASAPAARASINPSVAWRSRWRGDVPHAALRAPFQLFDGFEQDLGRDAAVEDFEAVLRRQSFELQCDDACDIEALPAARTRRPRLSSTEPPVRTGHPSRPV